MFSYALEHIQNFCEYLVRQQCSAFDIVKEGMTIRFGDLVRGSGRPRVVTLWTEPKKDRSFSKARCENRVLTVHTDPASGRKDYGEIGFCREPGAFYLVFPERLPEKRKARIVGINYQLAEEA